MEYLISISIVAAVLVLLLVAKNQLSYSIPSIIAGDVNHDIEEGRRIRIKPFDFIFTKGGIVNPKKHFIGTITGSSMEPLGLYDGDVIVGKKYIRSVVTPKKGDLLVIKISDKREKQYGELKIREFESFIDDNHDKIQTITYPDGEKRISRPHKYSDVQAIITDKIVK